jgi:hypothetical protein
VTEFGPSINVPQFDGEAREAGETGDCAKAVVSSSAVSGRIRSAVKSGSRHRGEVRRGVT